MGQERRGENMKELLKRLNELSSENEHLRYQYACLVIERNNLYKACKLALQDINNPLDNSFNIQKWSTMVEQLRKVIVGDEL